MLLAIDAGNTNVTFGLFDDNNLIKTFRIASDIICPAADYAVLLDNLLEENDIDKNLITECILASVVLSLTKLLVQAVKISCGVEALKLTTDNALGVRFKVDYPEEVGADRIANAKAASILYPNQNVVVVDFGTATNFDVVSKKSEFLGGVIAPGINVSADALYSAASLLPRVEITPPHSVIGKNTVDNILSGIVIGHAKMIEGLIVQIEQELDEKVVTVATGGYSGLIGHFLKRKFDLYEPNLTLMGLNFAYHALKSGTSVNL